jgi:hypothetical protein
VRLCGDSVRRSGALREVYIALVGQMKRPGSSWSAPLSSALLANTTMSGGARSEALVNHFESGEPAPKVLSRALESSGLLARSRRCSTSSRSSMPGRSSWARANLTASSRFRITVPSTSPSSGSNKRSRVICVDNDAGQRTFPLIKPAAFQAAADGLMSRCSLTLRTCLVQCVASVGSRPRATSLRSLSGRRARKVTDDGSSHVRTGRRQA